MAMIKILERKTTTKRRTTRRNLRRRLNPSVKVMAIVCVPFTAVVVIIIEMAWSSQHTIEHFCLWYPSTIFPFSFNFFLP
ncbi:hypothetical protein DM01DRAFT_1410585 [Hesseltinella vesiculosa]|uniref:Uncharacterized protein n=1 Tax=Hesseltinella vesiculosa TaxID=101127 RepID=A0A1X2G6S1_9FUNG|nr:hypothetical protein DM01DRAFT_1410585 [Hesseltinella vesiculosa]